MTQPFKVFVVFKDQTYTVATYYAESRDEAFRLAFENFSLWHSMTVVDAYDEHLCALEAENCKRNAKFAV